MVAGGIGGANVVVPIFRRIADRLATARETKKFARLLREVESPSTVESAVADIDAIFADGRTQDDALEQLVAFLVSRDGIAHVLQRYEVAGVSDRERLKGLYWNLMAGGAGQRIAGTYVATAGLYDPELLMLLLQNEADGVNNLQLGTMAMKFVEAPTRKSN